MPLGSIHETPFKMTPKGKVAAEPSARKAETEVMEPALSVTDSVTGAAPPVTGLSSEGAAVRPRLMIPKGARRVPFWVISDA